MKSNKLTIVAIIGSLVIVAGFILLSRKSENPASPKQPTKTKVSDEIEISETNNDEPGILSNHMFEGILEDVSGGNASGIAYSKFEDGTFTLRADFQDLLEYPNIPPEFYYEGWVVRKSPSSVISTGALGYSEESYVNKFTSSTNLTDHDFYVLTLEPDDGDPAPAEHVLEGYLNKINEN